MMLVARDFSHRLRPSGGQAAVLGHDQWRSELGGREAPGALRADQRSKGGNRGLIVLCAERRLRVGRAEHISLLHF